MAKKWIAFFSQTGSEIVNLSYALGVKPDLIVTNNMLEDKWKYHPDLRSMGTIMSAKHNMLMAYMMDNVIYNPKDVIITLHGYLRIIPAEVCSKYKMLNGHPGAIDLYPDLKGKDPQERTWENKGNYKFLGSVVHEVVPEVDAGRIIKSVHLTNNAISLEDTFAMLKSTSLAAWIFAMKEMGICV